MGKWACLISFCLETCFFSHFSLFYHFMIWKMIWANCMNLLLAAPSSELSSYLTFTPLWRFMTVDRWEENMWRRGIILKKCQRNSTDLKVSHGSLNTVIIHSTCTHRRTCIHWPTCNTHKTLSHTNHLTCECPNDVADINEERDMLAKAANNANHGDITLIPP